MPLQKETPSILTFQLLDDVMVLPLQERENIVNQTTIRRIGPLIEYAYHNYENAILYLTNHWQSSNIQAFTDTFNCPNLLQGPLDLSLVGRKMEFFKIPFSDTERTDSRWSSFLKRFDNAAESAGLDKRFAQALTGTCLEMVDNAAEHSGRPETGIVGYKRTPNEFEYVIADSGIGVLASLRLSSDYAYLVDSGQALRTAVTNGESRYGKQSKRGYGFHELLNNIANRNSYLRFRSGDHRLVIDGTRQPAPVKRELDACSIFEGFLISVICKTSSRTSN